MNIEITSKASAVGVGASVVGAVCEYARHMKAVKAKMFFINRKFIIVFLLSVSTITYISAYARAFYKKFPNKKI